MARARRTRGPRKVRPRSSARAARPSRPRTKQRSSGRAAAAAGALLVAASAAGGSGGSSSGGPRVPRVRFRVQRQASRPQVLTAPTARGKGPARTATKPRQTARVHVTSQPRVVPATAGRAARIRRMTLPAPNRTSATAPAKSRSATASRPPHTRGRRGQDHTKPVVARKAPRSTSSLITNGPRGQRGPLPGRKTTTARQAARPSLQSARATRAITTAAPPRRRLARKGAPPKRGKFVSKRQWRWAFANKMPWARTVAHRTLTYSALPARKR